MAGFEAAIEAEATLLPLVAQSLALWAAETSTPLTYPSLPLRERAPLY